MFLFLTVKTSNYTCGNAQMARGIYRANLIECSSSSQRLSTLCVVAWRNMSCSAEGADEDGAEVIASKRQWQWLDGDGEKKHVSSKSPRRIASHGQVEQTANTERGQSLSLMLQFCTRFFAGSNSVLPRFGCHHITAH